jgi:hypothetical protein
MVKVAGSISCHMFVSFYLAKFNSRIFDRLEIFIYDTYDRYSLCTCIDLSPQKLARCYGECFTFAFAAPKSKLWR